jgi:hypothetical protein
MRVGVLGVEHFGAFSKSRREEGREKKGKDILFARKKILFRALHKRGERLIKESEEDGTNMETEEEEGERIENIMREDHCCTVHII